MPPPVTEPSAVLQISVTVCVTTAFALNVALYVALPVTVIVRGFDAVLDDDLLGQKSWELAEMELVRRCVKDAVNAARLEERYGKPCFLMTKE